MTDVRKEANRMGFASMADEYSDTAMGLDFGMLGEWQDWAVLRDNAIRLGYTPVQLHVVVGSAVQGLGLGGRSPVRVLVLGCSLLVVAILIALAPPPYAPYPS